jgi:hypothetical protein
MPSLCSKCPNYGYPTLRAKRKRCMLHPKMSNIIRLYNCKDYPTGETNAKR